MLNCGAVTMRVGYTFNGPVGSGWEFFTRFAVDKAAANWVVDGSTTTSYAAIGPEAYCRGDIAELSWGPLLGAGTNTDDDACQSTYRLAPGECATADAVAAVEFNDILVRSSASNGPFCRPLS